MRSSVKSSPMRSKRRWKPWIVLLTSISAVAWVAAAPSQKQLDAAGQDARDDALTEPRTAERFRELDADGNGRLTADEVDPALWNALLTDNGIAGDQAVDAQIALAQFESPPPPPKPRYGIWSLAPAVLALVLAYATKNVLFALFLAIISASVIVFSHSGNWADLNFLELFLKPSLGTPKYATILLVYLWFLGGLLGIWTKTGGARLFAERIGSVFARGPRGSKLFAWVVGCIFHQGGTVSTVLAGTTVKPVADKHRVSHEELSYLVDSTASPVATILPFNAWPVYISGLVAGVAVGAESFVLIPNEISGVRWFLESIPYNFYGMFAVLSTFLFSIDLLPWTGRKMRRAIERARTTGELDAPDAVPLLAAEPETADSKPQYRAGLEDFFVPLGILLAVAMIPFFVREDQKLFIGEAFLCSTVSAMVLARIKGMQLRVVVEAFLDGCKSMTLGAIILGLALTLGNVAKELDTAGYVIQLIGGVVPAWLLPAALTSVCMVISFSIGSSFGTYAVIFPIAVPLALQVAIAAQGLNAEPISGLAAAHPEQWGAILFYVHVCFGAVMGGAVFGDQCSPISDTTILSSMFTGCDVMDHVTTQLPLALAAAGLGAICSTLLALFFF